MFCVFFRVLEKGVQLLECRANEKQIRRIGQQAALNSRTVQNRGCQVFCVNSNFEILSCPPKFPVIKNLAGVGICGQKEFTQFFLQAPKIRTVIQTRRAAVIYSKFSRRIISIKRGSFRRLSNFGSTLSSIVLASCSERVFSNKFKVSSRLPRPL